MMNKLPDQFLASDVILKKVECLANEISKDFQDKDLIFVPVLKGAFVFTSDLIRMISIPAKLDFIQVGSYGNLTESSGPVSLIKDIDSGIKNKNVLIVEDIVDSGKTLHFIINHLKKQNPASINVCALLDKKEKREIEVPVKYKGFNVPDKFFVGYGLDFAGNFRNLPYIGVFKES